MNDLMFLQSPFSICHQVKSLITHTYMNNDHQLHKQHFYQ